jgi:hypothetical protein
MMATNLIIFFFHVEVMKQDLYIPHLFSDALLTFQAQFCDAAVVQLTVR